MEENANQRAISTEEFNERHKPLQVPPNFDKDASMTDQVLYALGYLVEGSATEVAEKLHELNPEIEVAIYLPQVEETLEAWLAQAKINAKTVNGLVFYNLHKEVSSHKGEVPPEDLGATLL